MSAHCYLELGFNVRTLLSEVRARAPAKKSSRTRAPSPHGYPCRQSPPACSKFPRATAHGRRGGRGRGGGRDRGRSRGRCLAGGALLGLLARRLEPLLQGWADGVPLALLQAAQDPLNQRPHRALRKREVRQNRSRRLQLRGLLLESVRDFLLRALQKDAVEHLVCVEPASNVGEVGFLLEHPHLLHSLVEVGDALVLEGLLHLGYVNLCGPQTLHQGLAVWVLQRLTHAVHRLPARLRLLSQPGLQRPAARRLDVSLHLADVRRQTAELRDDVGAQDL
eukprot:1834054-Pyramimonas_sp.AAC.2